VPGEFLAEPLGQIKPTMYADLAILGSDPLQDIQAAADVQQVMANGVLHTIDTLLAPFTQPQPAAAAANPPLPPVPSHPANRQYWWHHPHYVHESRHACCTEA
jgi:hypothetical protein